MLKNIVFLFPGQGAQYQGMALDFLASSDAVIKLFDLASDIYEKDAHEMLRDSGEDVLKRTDVSQPAITLANIAAATYLGEQGYIPSACAGFSLGEYAALVFSGVISAADCFLLVKARGEAMQKTADSLREASQPGSGGDSSAAADAAPGMAAVVGLAPEKAEELIAQWAAAEGLKDIYAANINSPKQVVVSGTAAALTEAEARFKEAGARRVLRLPVAGPFHSPLMNSAAEAFMPVLESVTFNDPVIPLFSNVTGKQVFSGAEAKKLALQQITSPVRWIEEEAAIAALGFEACLEAGPGKVLQGLWRDSGSGIPVFAAGTIDDINNIEGMER